MSEYESSLASLRTIAREAGRAIMNVYAGEFDVELKDDRSPLTAADKASHELIVAGLAALEPPLPVLSEESPAQAVANRRQWQRFWLVDPLDGTKEFIKRNGEFTVNIALIDGHVPVIGVVYAPALDAMYSGAVGAGAWQQVGDEPSRRISVTAPAASPPRVVGSRSHASPALREFLERLGPHELRSMGSSLKICLVAAGEADVYPRLGPTSEWDTAAAHAVLLAAGGSMMDLSGEPLHYNARAQLLNPHFIACGDPDRDWMPGR
ncbi:MAG TPA: 3'(2'),5'-bisphosphate nucleotidase CysQ [Gammaproteobacteria bacterium]|nr:3'(2'),5'-bisphosphate nucleotidase CysQ [Gammaproteobacteria bacterium]